MLRNPTLSKALIKLDSRLAEAQELLMMATSE